MHTKKQIIVAIGREHGSGGHYIAQMISRALGVRLYDKKSIEAEVVDQGYSPEIISQMDERPVNFFTSRRIGKYSNSLEVNVAERTFQMLQAKAAQGESFVVLGRCGEQVLKNNPQLHQHFHLRQPPVQAGPNHGEAESGYGAGH